MLMTRQKTTVLEDSDRKYNFDLEDQGEKHTGQEKKRLRPPRIKSATNRFSTLKTNNNINTGITR